VTFLNRRALWMALPLVAPAAAAAVGAGIDGPSSTWAQRPFLTGVATGFLTLAVTVLVVNRLTELREDRRWRRVAIVAYRSIARGSRDISSALAGCGRGDRGACRRGQVGVARLSPG
jgi:4-hydroxybenzoate polyprenyltransferase